MFKTMLMKLFVCLNELTEISTVLIRYDRELVNLAIIKLRLGLYEIVSLKIIFVISD